MKKTKEYYEQEASLEEFLEWYQTIEKATYEKPSVTVDMVLLTPEKSKILLIQRKANPFRNSWALPGGFVNPNEESEKAVLREIKEETGVQVTEEHIHQYYTFTTPNRDPRGWVISIAYFAVLPDEPSVQAGDDAKLAKWLPIREENGFLLIAEQLKISLKEESGENIAFDHARIIVKAWKEIAKK